MQAAGSYRTSLNTKLHSAPSQKAEGIIFIAMTDYYHMLKSQFEPSVI